MKPMVGLMVCESDEEEAGCEGCVVDEEEEEEEEGVVGSLMCALHRWLTILLTLSSFLPHAASMHLYEYFIFLSMLLLLLLFAAFSSFVCCC